MKNKYKYGITIWSFPIVGPYMCKLAKDAGLDGVELELGRYEDSFPLSIKEITDAYLEIGREYSIEYPTLAVNTLCDHGMNNDYNSEEGKIVKKSIKTAVDVAATMKIKKIQLPSFFEGEIKNQKDLFKTAEFLKYACDYAKKHEIFICTENSLSIDENKKLFSLVNSNSLKLYFDSQNYYLLKGIKPGDIVKELKDFIIETHLKDGKSKMSESMLGEGDSGFYETAEALKEIQYRGWMILENYYHLSPLSDKDKNYFELLKQDLKTARNTFGENAGI